MCKNPLKRKVASQFLKVLAQFLTHYQHFCKKKKKKKKKSDAAPKSEEGGDEKQLCFLCGLVYIDLYGIILTAFIILKCIFFCKVKTACALNSTVP